MIQIGCLARLFNPYAEEVRFAQDNDFKTLQIWYDNRGIGFEKDKEPKEQVIKGQNFPSTIHALLDINEFEIHVPKLLNLVKYLDHKELIIHPCCRSESVTDQTIFKLCDRLKYALDVFLPENIKLYLENNSKIDPLFNPSREIEIMFSHNPQLEFLLDVAHIDNYEHLKEMVDIKMPKILHVTDRKLELVHAHVPLGQGNIDFEYVFGQILSGFKGIIILEIFQSSEEIIDSKLKLEKILKSLKMMT